MDRSGTGGLSAAHFGALVTDDLDGQGVVQINPGLSLEDLAGSDLLVNARIFLNEVSKSGGVKATAQRNLPRTFIKQMVDSMVWPDGYVDHLWAVNKVLNEIDVYPLHVIRVLLELSGLVHKLKGTFRVKNKYKHLLQEDSAGELYALLFKTHFQKLDLAYLDRVRGVHLFQHTIAYPLFMLLKIAEDWHRPQDLAPRLLLPQVMAEIPRAKDDDLGVWVVQNRLIRPLIAFGLLEKREMPSVGKSRAFMPYEVRKSPLFSRFLGFVFEGPAHLIQ